MSEFQLLLLLAVILGEIVGILHLILRPTKPPVVVVQSAEPDDLGAGCAGMILFMALGFLALMFLSLMA